MLAKVRSGASFEVKAIDIEVEVNVASKVFPSFFGSGYALPNKTVDESRERVKHYQNI